MKTVKHTLVVPHTQVQMYELVNDLNSYPQFVPGCMRVEIIEQRSDQMTAALHLQKGPLTQVLKTRNTLQAPVKIEMQFLEGPFKHFSGYWHFNEHNGATKVTFELQFDFESPFIGLMFGPFFEHITHNWLEAFRKRADTVYGTPHS